MTLISLTVPPAGDGTSIVALSDSSSTSGSSLATVSPAFTSTVMTGTSLKSPMSGTFTSTVPPPAAGAGAAAAGAGADDAAAAAAACAASSSRISTPSETLSPSAILISATLPAAGEGTSIVALSDSSSTSGSSTATVSPGFTITLMTGTSLKSPMSGTFTSIVAMCVPPVLIRYAVRGLIFAGSIAYFAYAASTSAPVTLPSL